MRFAAQHTKYQHTLHSDMCSSWLDHSIRMGCPVFLATVMWKSGSVCLDSAEKGLKWDTDNWEFGRMAWMGRGGTGCGDKDGGTLRLDLIRVFAVLGWVGILLDTAVRCPLPMVMTSWRVLWRVLWKVHVWNLQSGELSVILSYYRARVTWSKIHLRNIL